MLLLCFCFLVVATSTTSSPLSEDVLRALHSQIEKVGLRFYPTINLYSNVRPFIISLVVETHHSNSVFPYRLVLVPVCCIMFSMKNVYELISLSDTSVFELMFSLLVGLEWPDCQIFTNTRVNVQLILVFPQLIVLDNFYKMSVVATWSKLLKSWTVQSHYFCAEE